MAGGGPSVLHPGGVPLGRLDGVALLLLDVTVAEQATAHLVVAELEAEITVRRLLRPDLGQPVDAGGAGPDAIRDDVVLGGRDGALLALDAPGDVVDVGGGGGAGLDIGA